MVMWYIMALEPPMGLYTPRMFIDKVFKKGSRPATNVKWPQRLCNLMKECWNKDIFQRPTFVDIMKSLRDEMNSRNPQIAAAMHTGTESLVDSLPPEKRLDEPLQCLRPDIMSIEASSIANLKPPVSPLPELRPTKTDP